MRMIIGRIEPADVSHRSICERPFQLEFKASLEFNTRWSSSCSLPANKLKLELQQDSNQDSTAVDRFSSLR